MAGMASSAFELIEGGSFHALEASVEGGRVFVAPKALERATGWALKPEGLCRDAVCVPVRDRAALAGPAGVELAAFAAALGRPLALDVAERTAALGTAAAERGAALASLEAPDFALPDLAGRRHTLSEQRGKKALLIAYASW
jgi:hypothetical protein